MKKVRFLSVLVLVGILTTSCATTAFIAPSTKGLSLEEAEKVLNTPKKINAWLVQNMSWYKSGLWRTPEEIYESRSGSCIHWANLAAYLLDRNGYEAEVLYYRYRSISRGRTSGHALCVYKKDGKWWTCGDSNGRGVSIPSSTGPFKTLRDVAVWSAGDYGLRCKKCYSITLRRHFKKLSEIAAETTQPK